tara:strand:+ start:216 stop:545 length:330 start_codon:yes stop_codon:yes gene_type:complete
MPLLRSDGDQALDLSRQILGHSNHVVAETTLTNSAQSGTNNAVTPPRSVIHSDGEQSGTSSQGKGRWTSGQHRPLPEELNFDPNTTNVAIARQADSSVGAQHRNGLSSR